MTSWEIKEIFMHRFLLSSLVHTLNPEEADWFYTPVYTTCDLTPNGLPLPFKSTPQNKHIIFSLARMSCVCVSMNMVLTTGRAFCASPSSASSSSFRLKRFSGLCNTRRSNICALYSQPQDISSEIQDRKKIYLSWLKMFSKLLSTLGLEELCDQHKEFKLPWLSTVNGYQKFRMWNYLVTYFSRVETSKSANSSRDASFGLQFGLLSPAYLR